MAAAIAGLSSYLSLAQTNRPCNGAEARILSAIRSLTEPKSEPSFKNYWALLLSILSLSPGTS